MTSISSHYQSVLPLIIIKVASLPFNIANSRQIAQKFLDGAKQDVEIHAKQDNLTRDDKQWLAELLTWESLFPQDKNNFPGVRVSQPDGIRVFTKDPSPCDACSELECYRTYGGGCPLERVRNCPKAHHSPWKVRIGTDCEQCSSCAQQTVEDLTNVSGGEIKEPSMKDGIGNSHCHKKSGKEAAGVRDAKKSARAVGQGIRNEEAEAVNEASGGSKASLGFTTHDSRKRKRYHPSIVDEIEVHDPPFRGEIDQVPLMVEFGSSEECAECSVGFRLSASIEARGDHGPCRKRVRRR